MGAMPVIRGAPDVQLLRDPRILMNLLAHERIQRAEILENACSQPDITLVMRSELAHWMLQVCKLEVCEEGVFPLAMSYVQRYLSLLPLCRSHLRLLGCICLLIASKMRTERPMSVSKLEHYTGYTVSTHLITEWELCIIGHLHWDLAIIIPHDFIDHMLDRVIISEETRLSVRVSTVGYLTFCTIECALFKYAPSTLAAVCIGKSICDLGLIVSHAGEMNVYLSSIAETTVEEFMVCKTEIENTLCSYTVGDPTS
ncbi:G1/S-specific cyclin-D3-like isoform X2 [Dendrobates tinctorius]|uniref:G1/S-specific cyclin-D3-like isoform X2 n=1 Tax=Dendrobates tinctorius TaxID=92724 RepID=UPI003CC9E779